MSRLKIKKYIDHQLLVESLGIDESAQNKVYGEKRRDQRMEYWGIAHLKFKQRRRSPCRIANINGQRNRRKTGREQCHRYICWLAQ